VMQNDRGFFPSVGGGRFSTCKFNSLFYNILHIIVQIDGGVVVEWPELT